MQEKAQTAAVLFVQRHTGLRQHSAKQEKGMPNIFDAQLWDFDNRMTRDCYSFVFQYNKQHIIPLEQVKLESLVDDGRKLSNMSFEYDSNDDALQMIDNFFQNTETGGW